MEILLLCCCIIRYQLLYFWNSYPNNLKKVSLNQLSKELGLSKTTISMVLNGQGNKHKIKPKTQERILALARKYNYRPNQIARNLITGKTMTLGLIVPDISDSFYSSTAYYFEDKAE